MSVSARPTARVSAEQWTKAFRAVAIAEAVSWVGLLIGMFFKWIVRSTDVGVSIFGPIHGAIFLAYVVVAIGTARVQRWPLWWTTALALGASIPPLATVWFERWAARTGRLQPRRLISDATT